MTKHHSNSNRNVCVLLSGGIDSTACLAFYLEQNLNVYTLHVSYGQSSYAQELSSAKKVAEHYKVILKQFEWYGYNHDKQGSIMGRNAFLLYGALMEISNTRTIAIGIHSGTDYRDCSNDFIKKTQSIFDLYTNGTVQIGTPFLHWNKKDIWTYCKEHKIPIELTYSCENGEHQPCGSCLSCKDLEMLYASS